MVQSTSPADLGRARPSSSACRSRSESRHTTMKLAEALLIVALGIGSNACTRKPKVAGVPPAPAPVVAPAPAPPPEPLSIPQTNVHLPPPQPLTPEAIATTRLPGETPQEPPQTQRPQSKR